MSNTIKELGIDKLSPQERLKLAQELWDSIELDEEIYRLSLEWQRELDKRAEEADLHPELGQPWEIVKTELLKKLKCTH